jgi:hypothetical protein
MKEDFLHYLWKFKKFDTLNLRTSNNEEVTVANVGQYLELAGPDFLMLKLELTIKCGRNVEIHLKSSDWYVHHHERDAAYENVILHVVWEHDTEIYRKNNTEIPVLELNKYVDIDTITNYQALMSPKAWIFVKSS